MIIPLLPHLYLANEICDRLTVRIHTGLIEKGRSWIKVWYLLRGLDTSGSGFGRVSLQSLTELLQSAPSTIRQWLREGKAVGAFRFWAERRGIITFALGSLQTVCLNLKLWYRRAWGVVSEISLTEIHKLRQHATAVMSQHLQLQSRYAAKMAMTRDERKFFKVSKPSDFFEAQGGASQDSDAGALPPCCLKISRRIVWVSKGFIPFGCAQATIAKERGYKSDRTVRNHLNALGVERKQIFQHKRVYGAIANGIEKKVEYLSRGVGRDEHLLIGYPQPGDKIIHKLVEPNGILENFKPGGIHVHSGRFWQDKDGRWWMMKCSLYNLNYKLLSTEFSRELYEQALVEAAESRVLQKSLAITPRNEKTSFEVCSTLAEPGGVVQRLQLIEGKSFWEE